MSRIRTLAAAGIAAAALTTVAAVAAAPAVSAAPAKPTSVFLTVADGEAGAAITSTATLSCNPTGGTHPNAAQVCSSLTVVRGQVQMSDADPNIMCTMLYQPVTATMVGIVNGRWVDYQRTFGNACMMRAEMGSLFQF